MDFNLSDEQRMIYGYGEQLSRTYGHDYWMAKARCHEFPREMWQQMAEDGFLGAMIPEEYGGAGLGMMEMTLLMEGMSNAGIPMLMLVVGPTMSLAPIADHGSEDQKQRWLPAACRGEINFCFAITEATAGTNSIKINTLARANGNRFSMSGSKTFITGADVCDYALVVARTTPHGEVKRKTDGFTLFIVDLNAKGVERHPIDINLPIPESQFTIFFDEVDLGLENVIGEVGRGFDILFDSLNPERILVAALCCGIGRFALEKAVAYASEREVFDVPIGSHQGGQHPLAAAKTQVEMASLMMRQAAWQYDQGLPAGEASNMAKYAGAEAGIQAVDAALQAHGGNGFTEDYGIYELYPMVRLMRTAPVNREIILSYIGEKVMGLPRSY
ncbi:MAG: acyl-CoA/acyl-ACP dehydrogenase [Alphaproteobacteria bacterium]|nr:acyl-CoA/acyl-ACP dehydrogenase [Alphaproteobacteria bacterium]